MGIGVVIVLIIQTGVSHPYSSRYKYAAKGLGPHSLPKRQQHHTSFCTSTSTEEPPVRPDKIQVRHLFLVKFYWEGAGQ